MCACSPPLRRGRLPFLPFADWQATPTQTIGDTTWVLTGTDLPGTVSVEFFVSADKRIQNQRGLLDEGFFTLDYTVTLSGGAAFSGLIVDSTTPGLTEVDKLVNGLYFAKSIDGLPSLPITITGSPTSLTVHETIEIFPGSVMTP